MTNELPGIVMIHCPVTKRAIATGLEMTRTEFDAFDDLCGDAPCEPCRDVHRWVKHDAWLQLDKGYAL